VIDQFVVQPSVNVGALIASVALILIGVTLLLSSPSIRLIDEFPVGWYPKRWTNRYIYGFVVAGTMLILFGSVILCLNCNVPSPSMVTIYEGSIAGDSGYFFSNYGSTVGTNKIVWSDEIVAAFVGEVGQGDFKLHKEQGLDYGNTHVGLFTLGNGAKAYVTTTNATCLIIQINYGDYLIVGNQDTQAIANSFAQNVHPLTSYNKLK
jgi:hypothetical protein